MPATLEMQYQTLKLISGIFLNDLFNDVTNLSISINYSSDIYC